MAEPDLLAPAADLPFPPSLGDDFPDFPAFGDDAFALEDFDLEDLDFDFDVDLFSPDAPPPPPLATSSSSAAGSPEAGTSSTGDGGSKNEESADSSSSRSRVGRSDGGGSGKDEKDDEAKRRARLVRNRESAHQSRQRKKQYVEELQGKVKVMQATIADLTARISCVTAENAALKQQLSGATGVGAGAPAPPMYPAVYPLPMPWIHPAYAMRGSQVPLVPIPRLKTQQPASTPEPPAKKPRKTKKVAGVSLLGLLFLMMVCGCLVPAVNRMYGATYTGEGAVFVPSHHGRILAVEGPQNSVSNGIDPKVPQNGSETLPALLYLPRNGKHVKINGNLVIKSIVASEKASSHLSTNYGGKGSGNQGNEETSLAIPGYVAPLEAGEFMDSAKGMRNELMALAPGDGSIYREDDGMLPQWFSEAMSGPMLNSGMCTEVFQFDLSQTAADANGIVPVYSGSVTNTSQNFTENLPSGHVQKVKNRRILYSEAIPLQGSTSNGTNHFKAPPKNHSQSHAGRKPVSSVVVSVLADPREASDRDGEGRISSNSLSRIFVVVLIDSVKYVTYSCVLPFKSHSPRL